MRKAVLYKAGIKNNLTFLNLFTLLLFINAMSCKDATKDVFLNYSKYEKEIFEVNKYFAAIKPNDLHFYIKFSSWNKVDFKVGQKNYWDKTSWNKHKLFDKYGQFQKFDVSLDDKEIREMLEVLKIDNPKIYILKDLL